MSKLTAAIAPPSLFATLAEARCVAELMRYLAASERSLVEQAPRGDGRPILVIPGFLCSDLSTWMLRRFLRKIGYRSFAWKQGINWGPKPGVRTRLLHRVHQLQECHGQPVTIIGWSLGGFYARELACIRPDLIREVITLGSPLHGTPQATAVWNAFLWLNRRHMPQIARGEIDFPLPYAVPCLSIFTREDGIVPWQFCKPQRGLAGQHIEVPGSHIGLVANPMVMQILGQHLGGKRRQRRKPAQRSHHSALAPQNPALLSPAGSSASSTAARKVPA